MKTHFLLALYSLLLVSCDGLSRQIPPGVPTRALFDEKSQQYHAIDHQHDVEILRRWDLNGNLVAQTITRGKTIENTFYDFNGAIRMHSISIEGKTISREILKNGKLVPVNLGATFVDPPRPTGLPESATFNRALAVWEAGNMVNGKKEGEWTAWEHYGKPVGKIPYREGKIHGHVVFTYQGTVFFDHDFESGAMTK